MTADFSCPCGTTARIEANQADKAVAEFDDTVRRHFGGEHA